MTEPAGAAGGLRALLPAMLLTSILGYALQLGIPVLVDSATYVQFSSFWAMLFLCVAACSGVQQEIARAADRSDEAGASAGVLWRYTCVVGVVAAIGAIVVGSIVAATIIRVDVVAVVLALVIGVVGYAVLAALAGAMYGMHRWSAVVWTILADPVARTLLVGLALIPAFVSGLAPALTSLMLAVSVPFALAAIVVGWRSRDDIGHRLRLDADTPRLLRNTMHTVAAAASIGLMVSGMPLIVTAIGHAEQANLVAGAILLVTVVRAPLISPMLALQSFLTVSFRASVDRAGRRVAIISIVILAVAGIAAVPVAIWGPDLVDAVVPQYTLPELPAIVASLLSAGLVGVLCVTGAAVLARGSHRLYAAGWLVASIVSVAVAFIPLPFSWRLAAALTLGPLIGVCVHAAGLLRAHRTTPSAR